VKAEVVGLSHDGKCPSDHLLDVDIRYLAENFLQCDLMSKSSRDQPSEVFNLPLLKTIGLRRFTNC
jgi:hypothetical protein